MSKRYKFKPKADISIFALAEVLSLLDIQLPEELFDNLSDEVKDYFENV
jgi:hypothetical protein